MSKKKIIAIIPARSGSKGIKNKNIKYLNNRPLIAYTIDAALRCKFIDYVFVSTDSKKYAEISIEYGANVPFLRSKKNSSDNASSIDAVIEVLDELKKIDKNFDIIIFLQPTSPLRSFQDIHNSLNLFITKNASAVVSINKVRHPPHWCNTLPENLSMNKFIDTKYLNKPRQVFKDYFTLNGAISIFKADIIEKDFNIYKDGTYAYIMDERNSIDIDSKFDFQLAELMLKGGLNKI